MRPALLPALLAIALWPLAGCSSCPNCEGRPAQRAAAPTTRATPFLMFQEGKARPAIDLYLSVFPGSKIDEIEYWSEGQGAKGTIKVAKFTIAGQQVMVSDSPIKHAFTFTPSTSLFVDFTSEAELNAAFARLSEGGEVMMPIDDYGFSKLFAFCTDRYGVSWQLNLPN